MNPVSRGGLVGGRDGQQRASDCLLFPTVRLCLTFGGHCCNPHDKVPLALTRWFNPNQSILLIQTTTSTYFIKQPVVNFCKELTSIVSPSGHGTDGIHGVGKPLCTVKVYDKGCAVHCRTAGQVEGGWEEVTDLGRSIMTMWTETPPSQVRQAVEEAPRTQNASPLFDLKRPLTPWR